jgi:hypothetical protein
MKNLPKKIYLQIDADGEVPEDFKELEGVTWCNERIYPTDVEFILNERIFSSDDEKICDCIYPIVRDIYPQEYCGDCGKKIP